MANLKEVRNRIVSISSTQQITSAMKMVSAAKLKRAQDAVIRMRPYAEKLQEILSNLSASLDSTEGVYSKQREVKKVLYVVITSNRGLCGGFNANVIKMINSSVRKNHAGQEVSYLCIGKKGNDFYKKAGYKNIGEHNALFDELSYDNVTPVAENIMKTFREGDFDQVNLVYNKFKNAAVQICTNEQYLPVVVTQEEGSTTNSDYLFEPDRSEIVQELIPKSLKTQLFKALLDSLAAEHGARMTAMHKATDNAQDLLKELRLSYNKARQAAITNEILEIVGGAEALKN